MIEGEAACACLRVVHDPVRHEDGSLSSRWRCELCGRAFAPAVETAKDESERLGDATVIVRGDVAADPKRVAAIFKAARKADAAYEEKPDGVSRTSLAIANKRWS